jgi:hypothetical protein
LYGIFDRVKIVNKVGPGTADNASENKAAARLLAKKIGIKHSIAPTLSMPFPAPATLSTSAQGHFWPSMQFCYQMNIHHYAYRTFQPFAWITKAATC